MAISIYNFMGKENIDFLWKSFTSTRKLVIDINAFCEMFKFSLLVYISIQM